MAFICTLKETSLLTYSYRFKFIPSLPSSYEFISFQIISLVLSTGSFLLFIAVNVYQCTHDYPRSLPGLINSINTPSMLQQNASNENVGLELRRVTELDKPPSPHRSTKPIPKQHSHNSELGSQCDWCETPTHHPQ